MRRAGRAVVRELLTEAHLVRAFDEYLEYADPKAFLDMVTSRGADEWYLCRGAEKAPLKAVAARAIQYVETGWRAARATVDTYEVVISEFKGCPISTLKIEKGDS